MLYIAHILHCTLYIIPSGWQGVASMGEDICGIKCLYAILCTAATAKLCYLSRKTIERP